MPEKSIRTLIGESCFESLRNERGYYVDKTDSIREILDDGALTSIITRPRRFGKSLMLRTLQSFFQLDYENPGSTAKQEALFKGLAVLEDRDFCREHMGQWPVILPSFKDVDGEDFEQALNRLALEISNAACQVDFLQDSQKLRPAMRKRIEQLCELTLIAGKPPLNELMLVVTASLATLTDALYQHSGHPVLLLIDEYDTPLTQAWRGGFHAEMGNVLRPMLGLALKGNKALGKAVFTGCLPPAPELLSNGLNNLVTHSVCDSALSDAIGFTETETQKILLDFGLSNYAAEVKALYDGYQFGNTRIYSPWDVLNFCRAADHDHAPSYWVNSSNNDLIHDLVAHAKADLFEIFVRLSKGETVAARVEEAVSSPALDASCPSEHLLSVLLMTGYLTQAGTTAERRTLLRIPNKAVRQCFETGIERRLSAGNSDFSTKA